MLWLLTSTSLEREKAPYRIQTSDGKIYFAEVVNDSIKSDYEYDLATLRFKAKIDYPVARIGSSLYI